MDARFFTAAIRPLIAIAFVVAQFTPFMTEAATHTTPPAEMMQLLSYDQLMTLKPAQREQYIKSVRDILVDLERIHKKSKPNGYFSASSSAAQEDFGAKIAWLNAILPLATAEEGNVSREPAASVQEADNIVNGGFRPSDGPILRSGARAAAGPAPIDYARIVPSEPGIVMGRSCEGGLKAYPIMLEGRRQTHVCFQGKWQGSDSCNEGFVAVQQQKNGKFTCITKASYNLFQKQEDRELIRRPNAEVKEDNPLFAKFKDGGPHGGALAEFTAPPANPPQPQAVVQTEPNAGGSALLAATAGEASCEKSVEVPQCKDNEAVAKAREEYKKDGKDLSCIYAGTFQKYPNTEKRVGSCPRPTAFCLGAPASSCGRRSGPPAVQPLFKCQVKGEVLCNPLVFGVKKGGQPICIKAHGSATANCASEPGEREWDFLNRNEPGIQQSWDLFKADFDKICSPGNNAVGLVHCVECQHIRAGLLKANAAVASGSTGPLNCENQNWASVFESLKKRTASAPAAQPGQPAAQPAAPAAAPAPGTGGPAAR